MKKKVIIAGVLILLGLATYLGFRDSIVLIIDNQLPVRSEVQWTCNSVAHDEKISIGASEKVEKKLYPSCEGKFGITLTNSNGSLSQELLGYIPTGKSERISILLNESNKITFKIEE